MVTYLKSMMAMWEGSERWTEGQQEREGNGWGVARDIMFLEGRKYFRALKVPRQYSFAPLIALGSEERTALKIVRCQWIGLMVKFSLCLTN
jgi:hypothetical protein